MSKKFAQITNNIVSNIVIADDSWIATQSGQWIEFTDNDLVGVGFEYKNSTNSFIAPKPFPSWTLDSNDNWQAPVVKPEGNFVWNEETQSWVVPAAG